MSEVEALDFVTTTDFLKAVLDYAKDPESGSRVGEMMRVSMERDGKSKQEMQDTLVNNLRVLKTSYPYLFDSYWALRNRG